MDLPVIKIDNLSKLYYLGERDRHDTLRDVIGHMFQKRSPDDQFWALKDLSLQINKGEVIGIIGRNGSGKSTLLKILSQITPPTKGKITLRGRVASLLEIGTGFHPELTGKENIYLNGAILGMTRTEIRKKFNDIIKFADIHKFLDTPVKRYSSGMRVRLAFAIAAHLEPEILLVDEVLAVGDISFQKKSLGKMDSISKEGRTVLFVSHNMQAIRSLCSRAILLDQGKKICDGDVNTVINKYEDYKARDASVIEWKTKRPSTKSIQLTKAGVLINGRPMGSEFSVDKSLQIYISFKADTECKLTTAVLIHNQAGQLLFCSLSSNAKNLLGKTFTKGIHTNTCTIPPHLLSPGRYSISIGLSENIYEPSIIERDILHIIGQTNDTFNNNLPDTPNYGLISPNLDWSSSPDNKTA